MNYIDLLDKFVPGLKGYTATLTKKEIRMLRVALRTQDAINDVLDEEIELYKPNGDKRNE